jgi:hypothetical protein
MKISTLKSLIVNSDRITIALHLSLEDSREEP